MNPQTIAALAAANRPQVRGLKFQVFDCDARPIRVGDVLEWQETAGRYGQTARGRGTVTRADVVHGMLFTSGGTVAVHWEWKPADGPEGLYARHTNHSPDHGHSTWARIVSQ